MLAPATLAVINTNVTGERARARAFGAWSAVGGVGGMAGAIAGGAITTGLSWRWVFLIDVPICATLLAVAMTSRAGTRTGRRESFLVTGAIRERQGGTPRSVPHGYGRRRRFCPGARSGRVPPVWTPPPALGQALGFPRGERWRGLRRPCRAGLVFAVRSDEVS